MPKLKNISNGPRGVHTTKGLLMVEAGEVVDADLAKDETPVEEWFGKATAGEAKEPSPEPQPAVAKRQG